MTSDLVTNTPMMPFRPVRGMVSPFSAGLFFTASGVSPQNIQISPGTRVTFRNMDNRAHNMSSDPHPEHTDCTEINQVGLLAAGQTRETGNLNSIRTCRFHDHDLPNNSSLTGAIVIR